MFDTTLAIWIAAGLASGRSWAPMAVSAALLASALPYVLVGPLAGVFVDRWDRQRTMLAADAIRASLVVALGLATGVIPLPSVAGERASGSLALGCIYAAAFLAAVCSQFFGPARMAALGDVVPGADRPRASSLGQISTSLAVIGGPPIAAALYFRFGPGPALAADAMSFLTSYLAVRAVHLPPLEAKETSGGRGRYRSELTAGVRFFGRNPILTVVLVAAALAMLGLGALNALDIFFLKWNLHASFRLYGALTAVYGGGVLLGSAVTGMFAQRIGPDRAFWLSTVPLGVLVLIYARLAAFSVALPVVFAVGVVNAAINVAAMPLILNTTPREMLGRVYAVFGPVVTVASLISMAASGYLVGSAFRNLHRSWLGLHWGPIDTVFVASALLTLAGGLYAALRLEASRNRSVREQPAHRPLPGDTA